MVSCGYLWVRFFLTLDLHKIHSDSRFATAARPATNLLMSVDLGWILAGGLVISSYLWLVVFFFLHRNFKNYTAITDFTQRPARQQIC